MKSLYYALFGTTLVFSSDPKLRRVRAGKYLLKRLAEKVLPAAIAHRPKQGFFRPLTEWFGGRLRQEAQAVLAPGRARAVPHGGALSTLTAEHCSGKRNHSNRHFAL